MCTDFVLQVKWSTFWVNRGLRVYLDLYVTDFLKGTSKYFLYPSTFLCKTFYFGDIFVKRTPKSCKTDFNQKYIFNMSLDKFE